MPKRTNEFQQLVLLLQSQLSDAALVTESAMLTDLVHGDQVEVDVLVESEVSGIKVSVGFECTARSRPVSVEWVREMTCKHQTLPVDKTVLVSKSGFTKAALQRAAVNHALAIDLREATDADWAAYVAGLSTLMIGSFNFRSLGGSVNLEGAPVSSLDGGRSVRLIELGLDVSLDEYVSSILRQPSLMAQVSRRWLETPEADRKDTFTLKVNFVPNARVEAKTAEGEWRSVNHFDLDVEVHIVRTPISLSAGEIQGHQVAFGTAPNIFADKHSGPEYVLLNLVGRGGRPDKAALLIPASSKGSAKVLDMVMPDRDGD